MSVIGILAILAVIALSLNLGSPPPGKVAPPPTATTTTAPKNLVSGAHDAAVAACQANYTTIMTAVETYQALNGSDPPAGTTWATATGSSGPLLQSWPNGAPAYRLVWNGHQLSVLPTLGRASRGSAGVGPDVSGCYAIRSR